MPNIKWVFSLIRLSLLFSRYAERTTRVHDHQKRREIPRYAPRNADVGKCGIGPPKSLFISHILVS